MVLQGLGLLFYGFGVAVLAGFGVWAVIGLIAAWERVRDRLGARDNLDYAVFRAQQEIRDIRRQAIHDMLEAERDQRYAYDPDVIEGTAVEVRR
jgi:hypothetical protein